MAYTPYDYMPPSYGTEEEDEEERRRREAEEAAAGGLVGPAIPDLQQQQPQQPAPEIGTMPEPTAVAETPELTRSFATEPAAAAGEMEMVNGRLVRKTTPAVPEMPGMPSTPEPAVAPQPQVAMPAMPQPGPGVQVAGAPGAPMPQTQPAPAPAAAPSVGDMWTQAGSDPAKFLSLRNDTNLPVEIRKLAGREASRLALMEGDRGDQETAVKEKMATAAATGNFNEIAKMMKTRGEEGSWGRRVLFGMLGMEAAVKDEEAKLGIGAKWQTTTVTDPKTGETRNVLVKTRADGLPMEGYDSTTGTRLDSKALAGVTAGTAKLNIVGGTYVNDKTGEVGRVITDEKTGRSYIQTDSGRKPMSGFRPQATAGTLADQLAAAQTRAGVGLQYAAPTAAAQAGGRVAGETSATFGTPLQVPQQMPVGAAPGVPAPGAAPAPQMAPQMAPQPVAPAPVAPQAQPAQRPQTAPAAAVRPVAPAAGVPGLPAGGAGMTPAQLQQRQQLSTAAGQAAIETGAIVQRERLKPPAAEEGKQVATDLKNQRFADSTYNLMKPINEAILASTGSTIGAGVDKVAAAIGKSTDGSKAISRLNVLSYGILSNIPRFEGPQSDIDVQMYKQAAGDFANRQLPVEDRLAALDALRSILQRYDKAGKNDWTFGAQSQSTGSGTTSSGNKYKRVQ